MWLVVSKLDSTDIEQLHHCKKLYCTVLLQRQLLVSVPCELSIELARRPMQFLFIVLWFLASMVMHSLASASLSLSFLPSLTVKSKDSLIFSGLTCIFVTKYISLIRTISLYCLYLPLGWVPALHIYFAYNATTMFGTYKHIGAYY